jgi:hypothetical protein
MSTRTSLRSSTYRGLTGTPDNRTAAAEAYEPCSRSASGRVVALHKQLNDSAYRRARPGFGDAWGSGRHVMWSRGWAAGSAAREAAAWPPVGRMRGRGDGREAA